MPPIPPEALVARVDARQCEVLLPDGAVAIARLRGRLFEERGDDRSPLAVGDRVQLEEESGGWAVIAILPRRNLFCRRGSGEDLDQRQALAANVDQVVVVGSLASPPFSSIAADRILVACSFAGIPTRLVLNKTDLAPPELLADVHATYAAAGVPIHATCAADGSGLADLHAATTGRTSVFYGLSGVGKSTLINRMAPGAALATRGASEALGSGRHTTTYSRLVSLPGGGRSWTRPACASFVLTACRLRNCACTIRRCATTPPNAASATARTARNRAARCWPRWRPAGCTLRASAPTWRSSRSWRASTAAPAASRRPRNPTARRVADRQRRGGPANSKARAWMNSVSRWTCRCTSSSRACSRAVSARQELQASSGAR